MLTLLAATALSAHDYVIVPGVRIGPIMPSSTESELRRVFGMAAVKAEVEIGEGFTEPGLKIYKDDPARALAVLWNNDTPPHPKTVLICQDVLDGRCRWRTADDIGKRTTLSDLERRNGRPFVLTGWGWDYGGGVLSWEGGKLQAALRRRGGLMLTLCPRTNKDGEYVPAVTADEVTAVSGDKEISSSFPVMQKLDPYVCGMSLQFAGEAPGPGPRR
jgi:hypothetical protein